MAKLGFLLLCGGQSKRMGVNKATIDLGGSVLMDAAARAGRGFDVRIFSANDPAIPTPEGFVRVADVYPGCGPMAGIHAALLASDCDALVVAPCDAPHYSAELAAYLADHFEPGLDALILEDEMGKVHPIMGVYARSCLGALQTHLEQGKYKMMLMLDGLYTLKIRLPENLDRSVLDNLNTPEDVRRYENEIRQKYDRE